MTTDDKIGGDIHRERQKYHHYYQVKLINMNTLQAKKQYHLIKKG